jgi:hypothetical protein
LFRYLPVAFAVLLVGTDTAIAQSDPMGQARLAAYNQVGVMEYCQSHGYADAASVTAQRASLARLPAAPVTPEMTAAETMGRNGTIASPNGTATTLAEMAGKTNTSEASLCGRMVESVKQTSAMTTNGMSAPGAMPAMPGGMPATPSGMPAMPSAPPTR